MSGSSIYDRWIEKYGLYFGFNFIASWWKLKMDIYIMEHVRIVIVLWLEGKLLPISLEKLIHFRDIKFIICLNSNIQLQSVFPWVKNIVWYYLSHDNLIPNLFHKWFLAIIFLWKNMQIYSLQVILFEQRIEKKEINVVSVPLFVSFDINDFLMVILTLYNFLKDYWKY